jgi:hypothetical protein
LHVPDCELKSATALDLAAAAVVAAMSAARCLAIKAPARENMAVVCFLYLSLSLSLRTLSLSLRTLSLSLKKTLLSSLDASYSSTLMCAAVRIRAFQNR